MSDNQINKQKCSKLSSMRKVVQYKNISSSPLTLGKCLCKYMANVPPPSPMRSTLGPDTKKNLH